MVEIDIFGLMTGTGFVLIVVGVIWLAMRKP